MEGLFALSEGFLNLKSHVRAALDRMGQAGKEEVCVQASRVKHGCGIKACSSEPGDRVVDLGVL